MQIFAGWSIMIVAPMVLAVVASPGANAAVKWLAPMEWSGFSLNG